MDISLSCQHNKFNLNQNSLKVWMTNILITQHLPKMPLWIGFPFGIATKKLSPICISTQASRNTWLKHKDINAYFSLITDTLPTDKVFKKWAVPFVFHLPMLWYNRIRLASHLYSWSFYFFQVQEDKEKFILQLHMWRI